MATFKAGAQVRAKFVDMALELEDLLGYPADLVDRESIETMENWIKRKSILSCAKTIYAVED